MTLILDVNVVVNISIFFACMILITVSTNHHVQMKKRKKRKHTKDKTARGKKSAKRRKPTKR